MLNQIIHNNIIKICKLCVRINNCLTNQIFIIELIKNYLQYVIKIIYIINNIIKKKIKRTTAITNKLNLHRFERKNSSKTLTTKQFASKIQNLANCQKKIYIIKLNEKTKKLIIKKKAYVECFISNYYFNDFDKLYKNQSLFDVNQIKVKFVAINIF